MTILYSPTGSVVRAVRSRPEPNVETEEKVREQLKSLDSLLDIKWIEPAVLNPKTRDWEGRYALICQWPSGDNRWQLVQTGQTDKPYDILGWFTVDLQDPTSVPVAPDMIMNLVLKLLAKCDGERMPHTKRLTQILEKNDRLQKQRKQEYIDRAGDVAGDLHYISGHIESTTLDRIKKEIANMEDTKNG